MRRRSLFSQRQPTRSAIPLTLLRVLRAWLAKTDGYLGIVGEATPALQRLVDDINIKRRAVYADKARENRATIEEYAFSVGCQTILLRVKPGEKYQAPDGTWLTRTSEPPIRDPRCP